MRYYILALLFPFTVFSCSHLQNSYSESKTDKAGTAKLVFKSTDGGQTWEDISKGLPETVQTDGIPADSIFANEKGLFVKDGNELYRSTVDAGASFWTAEISSAGNSRIAPGKSGIFTCNYWSVNLKKKDGTSVWSPIFENFQEPRIRSVFETTRGVIFIGIDRGLFRSSDNGKNWKHVHSGGLAGHMAESDGVLLATSMRKIIRSVDHGENWTDAPAMESVFFDVKPIKGGFVAITAESESGIRSLMTSYDAGISWQPIDARNKAFSDSIWRTWDDRVLLKAFGASVAPMGDDFLCIHPDGIFKSIDKGKTWKLLLPSTDGRAFRLFGSGNIIYAIRSKVGC